MDKEKNKQIHSLMAMMPQITKSVTSSYKSITPENMTYQQMQLLMIIKEVQGLRPLDYAEILEVKKQQITVLLNALEEDDYICRRQDQTDKRSTGIYLTKNGIVQLEKIDAKIVESFLPAFDRLSENEQKETAEYAEKLTVLLRKMYD